MLQPNRVKYSKATFNTLSKLLEQKTALYNIPDFIANDPILIPHQFTKLQDIEISGFWTAMLAWGQRKTIINKSTALFELMDNEPHAFMLGHCETDLKRLANFKHRTFNYTDTLYFIHFFNKFYTENNSLENAFLCPGYKKELNVEKMLIHFHTIFFNDEHAPHRTRKHVPTPLSNSTCKRLNMFLRWMVRSNKTNVDFGVWKNIRPDQLVCPLDVHVDRIARRLQLLTRKQTDWTAALELTENLKQFDPHDPVKYDFALFGSGVMEKVA